ncbi:hypothetical protein D3C86_1338180 [compost metagenome]
MVSEKPAVINSNAKITRTNSSEDLTCNNLSIAGTSFLPNIRNVKINPNANNDVPATVQKELLPVRINPERNEICMAINKSSNIIIPIITSVSGLAVRFKSVNTLATIAVEELVIIPHKTIISLKGRSIIQPISKPEIKLSST